MPSVITVSAVEVDGIAASRAMISPSTTTSATMTTTLAHSQSACTTSSQPALSSIDAAARYPIRRCRSADV